MNRILRFALCTTLLVPVGASAQQAETAPASAAVQEHTDTEATPAEPTSSLSLESLQLKFSGVIFASWGMDVSTLNTAPGEDSGEGAHRFELSRAYLNFEPKIGKKISARITPDLVRARVRPGEGTNLSANIDGNLLLRLKYAYVTFSDVLPGISVKAGVQQTAFINYADDLWKYRVLGVSAYEYFTGNSSADLGVGLVGKHLDGILEWQVVLANGESYSKPERSGADGRYKDLGVRLTVAPLGVGMDGEGLRLTAFGQYAIDRKSVDGSHLEKSRLLGQVAYVHRLGTLGFEYALTADDEETEVEGAVSLVRRDGHYLSAFGFVNLPLNLRAVGRYDRQDPDHDRADDERTRIFAGLAYLLSDEVQLIGDWQHYGFDAEDSVAPGTVQDAAFVHLEAKF